MKYFVLFAIVSTFLTIGIIPIHAQYTEHVSDPSLARHHPSWVLGSNDMNYSQFLDFCDNYDSALSDSMSTKERMMSNLCDFRDKGFDEKQWNWLNGTKLDWKNFVQKKAEEYAVNLSPYKEHGIKDSLTVKSVVSLRESFPPPMSAIISFDYIIGPDTKQYKKEFMVGIAGLSERTDITPSKTENFIGNDLVSPQIPSPLKQFKSGIQLEKIQCKQGLMLVKKHDNRPVCVKQETLQKLQKRGWVFSSISVSKDSDAVVPRGDIFLVQLLRIEGLDKTQHVGQKIQFTVKYNGTKSGCQDYPTLRIENSEHKTVWESGKVVTLCDPDMKPHYVEKIWKVGDTPLGIPIINQTGFYTLFVEFENDIIQQDFWVKPSLQPQNIVDIADLINKIPLDFSYAEAKNPLGIQAKVTMEQDNSIMCPVPCVIPFTPHLVLTAEKGTQFIGYEVCSDSSCKKDKILDGLYVFLDNIPEDYSGTNAIELNHINLGDLGWKKGNMVHIKVVAFPATLLKNNVVIRHTDQIMTYDLGKSKIE